MFKNTKFIITVREGESFPIDMHKAYGDIYDKYCYEIDEELGIENIEMASPDSRVQMSFYSDNLYGSDTDFTFADLRDVFGILEGLSQFTEKEVTAYEALVYNKSYTLMEYNELLHNIVHEFS